MIFNRQRKASPMLIIYGVPVSVHTRKALVTARLKNLDIVNEPVIPFDPPENWSELSPAGTIPALKHGDFVIGDSSAICAYLDRLGSGASIYPASDQKCAKALWLEQYAASVLFRTVIHPLFFEKVIRPGILKQGEPNEEVIEDVLDRAVPACFAFLEQELAGERLLANTLTIADIAVVSNLLNFAYLGFRIDASRHPRLAQFFAAVLALGPFKAALEAERPFAEQMQLDRTWLPAAA